MEIPKVRPSFAESIREPLLAARPDVLQINVGYRCNLKCSHCHVDAGPERSEVMAKEVMEECLKVLRKNDAIRVVDITGGSPELHPHLPWFLTECASLGRRVLVRSNGVILLSKDYEWLIDFYARNKVELMLSLPHLDARLTDRQRGEGVFARLIEVMSRLNEKGYGDDGSGLVLNIVLNPPGAYLPGSQAALEPHYRQILRERHGLVFNRLFSITNIPVGRYLHYLVASDNYDTYMKTLVKAFNPTALGRVMCRSTLSVAWDGRLYDCDFNQMLGMAIDCRASNHICDFSMARLIARQIVVGDHCYGCTAGLGSSCQGQTVAKDTEK